ncbi:hypothetical protein [Bifidobacterium bohemicum]|uniref:hypothetical protein n=1 Tax=Bifidobacterium bohemicum TaxID=638617 RepID=UPI001178CCDF|nr:hypothetical protein [Bifidobacterium bohemicum]
MDALTAAPAKRDPHHGHQTTRPHSKSKTENRTLITVKTRFLPVSPKKKAPFFGETPTLTQKRIRRFPKGHLRRRHLRFPRSTGIVECWSHILKCLLELSFVLCHLLMRARPACSRKDAPVSAEGDAKPSKEGGENAIEKVHGGASRDVHAGARVRGLWQRRQLTETGGADAA